MRMTASKIQPLDKALEGKIREIQILLDKAAPARKIKEFLEIEGKGAAELSLHVRVDGNRIAHIKLPGRWSLSQQARNIIRTQDGVLEISEG